jgi:hypothetical protein
VAHPDCQQCHGDDHRGSHGISTRVTDARAPGRALQGDFLGHGS